ncbi:hypothetical protein Tco_0767734 [Tanacetum coccineum]
MEKLEEAEQTAIERATAQFRPQALANTTTRQSSLSALENMHYSQMIRFDNAEEASLNLTPDLYGSTYQIDLLAEISQSPRILSRKKAKRVIQQLQARTPHGQSMASNASLTIFLVGAALEIFQILIFEMMF